MSARIRAAWLRLPLTARKAIVDFVETFAGLVIGLNALAILTAEPGVTRNELAALGTAVAGAAAAAFVSAMRRHGPAMLLALRGIFVTALVVIARR